MPETWQREASFLKEFDKSGGFAPNYPWQPLRCATSLKAPYGALVAFLAEGHGYDNSSLRVAIGRLNERFAERRLEETLEMCAIAYEIARLHFDYRPLLFDLVIRRVLCLSMLGQTEQGLKEAGLAEQIVPCTAVAQVILAILCSKLGNDEDAFRHLQRANEIEEDSADFFQCAVALLRLYKGNCEQAIEICSKVLQRKPIDRFALLVRGDAYKCDPLGGREQLAKDDHAALLERDAGAPVGRLRPGAEPQLLDEVILRFHPYLNNAAPRPYEDYPMYWRYLKRQHFSITCLVVYFVARLKMSRRSRRVHEEIAKAREELLDQRVVAEQKLWRLLGTYKNLSSVEASKMEVWGPADPDSVVRKYRRYWMEKPLSFPRRKDGTGVTPSQAGHPDDSAPRLSSPSRLAGVGAITIRPEDVPQCTAATWAVEQARLLAEARSAGSPDGEGRRFNESPRLLEVPRSSGSRSLTQQLLEKRIATHSPETVSGCLGMGGVVAEAKRLAGRDVTQQAPSAGKPGTLTPTTPTTAHGRPGSAATSERSFTLSSTSAPGAAAGVPSAELARTLQQTLDVATTPEPPAVPYQRLGVEWGEEQWYLKALECGAQLGDGRAFQRALLPEIQISPPPTSQATVLAHLAGDRVAEVALTSALLEGPEVSWSVIPEWYSPLDRVYEVTEMVGRCSVEEPLVLKSGAASTQGSRCASASRVSSPSHSRSCVTPRLGARLTVSTTAPSTQEASSPREPPGSALPACPPPASAEQSAPSRPARGRRPRGSSSRAPPPLSAPNTAKEKLHDWHRQEVLRRNEESERMFAAAAQEDGADKRERRQRWEAHRRQQKKKLSEWSGTLLSRREQAEHEAGIWQSEARPLRAGGPPAARRPRSASRAGSSPGSARAGAGLARTA